MEAQTVFVYGVDDTVQHPGGRLTTIAHTASGGDYDENDEKIAVVDVKVKITDFDDDPGIVITLFPSEDIPDAATSTPSYMVGLSTAPSVEVTVVIEMEGANIRDGLSLDACPDASLLQKRIELSFAAAVAAATTIDGPKPVTICVGDDEDNPGSIHKVTIKHTASGGEYNDILPVRKSLMVIDDEDKDMSITGKLVISRNGIRFRENSYYEYTVRLDSDDDRDAVTVRLDGYDNTVIKATNDKMAVGSPQTIDDQTVTLDFTEGTRVLTVYVVGIDDDVVGERSTHIIHTVTTSSQSEDLTYNPVEVPITITDHGDTAELLITETLDDNERPKPVVNEGGGISTYFVKLNSSPPPGGEVKVYVISKDPSSVNVDNANVDNATVPPEGADLQIYYR